MTRTAFADEDSSVWDDAAVGIGRNALADERRAALLPLTQIAGLSNRLLALNQHSLNVSLTNSLSLL